MLQVQLHEILVLFESPLFFDDVRVQVVVVPLAALLAGATRQLRRYKVPALGSVLFDQHKQLLVLFLGPRSLLAALNLILLLK